MDLDSLAAERSFLEPSAGDCGTQEIAPSLMEGDMTFKAVVQQDRCVCVCVYMFVCVCVFMHVCVSLSHTLSLYLSI